MVLFYRSSTAQPEKADGIIYNLTWDFQIVEFISVLLTVGSEAAEKELIQLGAVQRILNLFFE